MQWFRQHVVLTTLLVITIILALVVTLSSQIAVLAARHYLSDYASDIAIERLSIQWLRSKLILEGFAVNDTEGRTVAVDELVIDWTLPSLSDSHLEINSLTVSGLSVDIETRNFVPLSLGPIPLISGHPSQDIESEIETNTGSPWSISLSNMMLEDISICLKDNSVNIDQLSLPLANNVLLNHCLSFGELSLASTFQLDKSQSISYTGSVNLEQLRVEERDGQPLARLDKLRLDEASLADALFQNKGLFASGVKLLSDNDLDISDIGLGLNTLTVDSLSLSDAVVMLEQTNVSNLAFYSRASDESVREVMAVAGLSVASLGVDNTEVTINNIEFASTKLLELLTDSERSHHVAIEQLILESYAQSAGLVNIGQLSIMGLDLALALTADGTDLVSWFPVTKDSGITENVIHSDPAEYETQEPNSQTAVADDGASQEPSSQLLLAGITIGAKSRIQLTDTSLNNAVTHNLKDINLSVASLDTGVDTTVPTAINFMMNYEPMGKLTGNGALVLGNELNQLNMTGVIEKLDMVSLSDYASRYIGYRIDSGLLDVEYVISLQNKQLDVEIKTLLEKFELGALQDHEQHELNAELGIPLPIALNLLRDSNNNIALDFPIKGSINDPQFSVSSIVSTVAGKAIKNAVIYHYSPLGMLSLASGVLDLATALSFEPVVFEPASINIDQRGEDRLAKVIDVMNKKPRVTMLICASATETDLLSEVEQAGELTEQLRTDLLKIAQQRQAVVIDYLVREGSIARARLLGCNIKFAKSKGAKPIVGISI